jgi:hypothetical protein
VKQWRRNSRISYSAISGDECWASRLGRSNPEENVGYSFGMRLSESQTRSGCCGEEKIFYSCRKSNPNPLVTQSVAQSLFWLIYTGSCTSDGGTRNAEEILMAKYWGSQVGEDGPDRIQWCIEPSGLFRLNSVGVQCCAHPLLPTVETTLHVILKPSSRATMFWHYIVTV